MKLSSGKRIGQSGQEFTAAVFFSFILHVIILCAAVLLAVNVAPRKYTPPFYEVKLVGQPADLAVQPPAPQAPAPAPPLPRRKESKAPLKAKKAAPKARKAEPKKGAMPSLAEPKVQPTAPEQAKPTEALPPQPKAPSEAAAGAGQAVAKTEGVAVSSQQDFKFGWYLAAVRDKIQQNWNPPPSAKETMARVLFTINRSGWVLQVNVDEDHSNGSFDFKQAAIRAIRMSRQFPSLPEDFPGQTLEFSVDLTPKE